MLEQGDVDSGEESGEDSDENDVVIDGQNESGSNVSPSKKPKRKATTEHDLEDMRAKIGTISRFFSLFMISRIFSLFMFFAISRLF